MNEISPHVKGIAKIIQEHQEQLSNTKEPVRYVVRTHLFSSVIYNTFRYRKLAFAHALKVIMYTSGWCVIYKEELIDKKWILVRRWEYD